MKLKLLLLLSISMLSFTYASTVKNIQLNGGFIQYRNALLPRNWTLDEQRRIPPLVDFAALAQKVQTELNMDTIVIQNLSTTPSEKSTDRNVYSFLPLLSSERDITFELLEFASRSSMDVYLGLDLNDDLLGRIGKPEVSESDIIRWLINQTKKDKEVAQKIYDYYCVKKKQTFAGWYITTEIPNFNSWKSSSNLKNEFKKYLKEVSAFCKQLSDKVTHVNKPHDIAISPYFNHAEMNSSDTSALIKELIGGSDINTLFVQDGCSAFSNDSHTVISYFNAIQDALPTIKVFADLEILGTDIYVEGLSVAPIWRLLEQLCNMKDLHRPAKCLVFDLHHYMNPLVPDVDISGNKVAQGFYNDRIQLYHDYVGAYQEQGFPCGPEFAPLSSGSSE